MNKKILEIFETITFGALMIIVCSVAILLMMAVVFMVKNAWW
jgi:hypothetical protein